MAKENTLQLKVKLINTEPLVWRRILVPAEYSFFELHVALQDAMGWTDSHLHQFFTADPYKRNAEYKNIALPMPDMEGEIIDERKAKLSQWLKAPKDTVLYEYDFGDGWMHEIKLEKILPREQREKYPQLIDGENACPLEDCGGLGGYAHLLDVLADPKGEEHEDMLEWLGIEKGEEFDPTEFNPKEIEFEDPKKRLKQ